MINIAFDVDEVVLQYINRFCEVFQTLGGKTDLSKPKEFNLYKLVPDDERQILSYTFGYMMNEKIQVYQDFAPVIKFFSEENREIKFITSRNTLALDSAIESINEIKIKRFNEFTGDIEEYNIKFSIDSVNGSKLNKVKEYGLDYFIDDKRQTCLELAANGIIVFMPRRSWNTLQETKNIIQYNNAEEILQYFN